MVPQLPIKFGDAGILVASLGASLDLKKLLAYPIPTTSLFWIEVMLRVTTGIEMLLILTAGAIGLILNPTFGRWAKAPRIVAPLLVFVVFNLLLAARRSRAWLIWFLLGNCFVPFGVRYFDGMREFHSPAPLPEFEIVARVRRQRHARLDFVRADRFDENSQRRAADPRHANRPPQLERALERRRADDDRLHR